MSYFVVDVESDGAIPYDYSMVCFGSVVVEPTLSKTFYGQTKPISEKWNPDALAISGFSREEHLEFDDPKIIMGDFLNWIKEVNRNGKPIMISDNIAYDFAWINWYFHHFIGKNPFGWSGRRIGDLYCGMQKDVYKKWKFLRTTKHDHNPVNDAIGNAEALLKMKEMGLKIKFK